MANDDRLRAALVCCVAAIALQASPILADEGGEWIWHAPMNLARQEVGAARIGREVFVAGGLLAGAPLRSTNTVEAYDIAEDQWRFVAPMSRNLHHMGVVAVDGLLYVIGGYRDGTFTPVRDLLIYDPDTNEWTTGRLLPEPRGAGWAVAHEGKVYLVGGRDHLGINRASMLIYDPIADEWSQGSDMPTVREHLTATSAGRYIYVIGGRNGSSTRANERYDPVSDTWQVMAPMPTARSATLTATFGSKIFVAGGEVPRLFAINEVYDIPTDTWSCQAPMALPRHGIAAVTLDDRILAPAGGVVQGLAPTALVDSFIPAPIPGDFNGDGLVDLTDLAAFDSCLTGPDAGPIDDACRPGDFDQDDDIDLPDFAALTRSWTPPF